MCTLEGLRDALRRRDVYVAPSERYADARASLLSDVAWVASRQDTQRSLSLPSEPGPFLQQLGSDLDDAYSALSKGSRPSIRFTTSPPASCASRRSTRSPSPQRSVPYANASTA